MIRAVTVTSLVTLLMLVLYLPSSHAPEQFLAQLRIEHERTQAFWGMETAERILDRMLTLQRHALTHSPVPAPTGAPTGALTAATTSAPTSASTGAPEQNRMASAVAHEMAQVNARLFNNRYFRSIDALLALAAYRLATLLEWLPAWWIVGAALLLDALLERALKAKELRSHDPELFALYASVAILLMCSCVLAFVWSWSLPPLLWAAIPPAIALVAARATSHFHKRP